MADTDEIATLRFDGKTFKFPFAGLFRRHTPQERSALAASIREHKVLGRVVTYDSTTHGKRCVIDGQTRLEIAGQIGLVTVPVHHRGELSDERAGREATALNLARRHLSPEEQEAYRLGRNRDIVADRLDGDSLGVIAERHGLSRESVRKILEEAGVNHLTPERVTGADGKSYSSAGTRTVDPRVRAARRIAAALGDLLERDGVWLAKFHQKCRAHRLDDDTERLFRAVLADLAADSASAFAHPPEA